MSLHDSRPSSRTPALETRLEDSKNNKHRKGNPDSGFHEESINSGASTPSSISSSHFKGHHDRLRGKHPLGETTEDLRTSTGTGHGKRTRHTDSNASIITNFSGNQEIYDIDNDSSDEETEKFTRISKSISLASARHTHTKDGFAEATPPAACETHTPATPPPTSLQRSATGEKNLEYEIPSDTELAEIIAIMSGLATPRRQKSNPELVTPRLDPPAPGITTDPFPHHQPSGSSASALVSSDALTRQRRPTLEKSKSLVTRDSNGRLYEKRNAHANPHGPSMGNGAVPNGHPGKRYLMRQGSKSLDGGGSWPNSNNGSLSDLRMVSGKSRGSQNSLNSILAASKAGYIGPKKKKKKKPKPPPPPPNGKGDGTDYREPKKSWKERLKFFLTFLVSVTLILASSSLLFIVPLIVDPILVGLEADFINSPVMCQTVAKRNATGAGNCTTPSCREGCTADLMFCYYIEVQYQNRRYNTSAKYLSYHVEPVLLNPPETDTEGTINGSMSPEFSTQMYPFEPETPVQEGILLVNPMGCGYPPELNCTEFEKKFGEIGYTFPCQFSQQNDTIVVPKYDRSLQVRNMSVALVVPCSLTLICSILLYLLLRWNPRSKRKKKKSKQEDAIPNTKSSRQAKNLSDADVEERAKRAANGALGNLMGDLTGITGKNVLQKRNYASFSPTHLKGKGGGSDPCMMETDLDTELCILEDSLPKAPRPTVLTAVMNGHVGKGSRVDGHRNTAESHRLDEPKFGSAQEVWADNKTGGQQNLTNSRVKSSIWKMEDEAASGGSSSKKKSAASQDPKCGNKTNNWDSKDQSSHEVTRKKSIDSIETRTNSAATLSLGKI